MKLVHSEWKDRVKHWMRTLKDDLYEPLGEISWEAFPTMEYLTPEEAQKGHAPIPFRACEKTAKRGIQHSWIPLFPVWKSDLDWQRSINAV